jgi:arsenite-transporting ATPase
VRPAGRGGSARSANVILFGGKGGVGKTTCAAACAVQRAEAGCRTLLLSTDPAHSLADCLEQEIGPDVREVEGIDNLWALEVSAERREASWAAATFSSLPAHVV